MKILKSCLSRSYSSSVTVNYNDLKIMIDDYDRIDALHRSHCIDEVYPLEVVTNAIKYAYLQSSHHDFNEYDIVSCLTNTINEIKDKERDLENKRIMSSKQVVYE